MNSPIEQTNPPLRLLAAFQAIYPGQIPALIVQAPGREMWVAALMSDSQGFTIHAPDLEARTHFDWRSAKFKRTVLNRPLPGWARYSAGVIHTLCAEGMDLAGLEAVAVGEEPSGPRYDYALGMAFAALWHTLHQRAYDQNSLLDLMERVRRTYMES